jgi:PKHD-type hydroxylase
MEYIISPMSVNQEQWAWVDDVFTEGELDYLQLLAMKASVPAGVGNNNKCDSYRRSNIEWLHITEQNRWLFDRIGTKVADFNSRYFQLDLLGFGEAFQLTNYQSENYGMYNWHIDKGVTISRKLSVVVQLSHPEEYTGGELQLLFNQEPDTIVRKRGMVVMFPSYTLHRVTPVTSGSRQSLVSWVTGPQFR